MRKKYSGFTLKCLTHQKKKKNEKCCNLQEDQQNDKSQRGSHFCLSFTIFDDQTIQINITIWNIKREMRALSARGRIQRFYALEMCSRVDWITNFNIRRTEITPFLPIAKAWGRAYVKGYITKCVEVIGQSAMDTRQQKQYLVINTKIIERASYSLIPSKTIQENSRIPLTPFRFPCMRFA